jgi:hypothetical protein
MSDIVKSEKLKTIILAACAVLSPMAAALAGSANTVAILETRLHYMERDIERNTEFRENYNHEA